MSRSRVSPSRPRIAWWLAALIAAVGLAIVGDAHIAHAANPAAIWMSFQFRATSCTKAVAKGPSVVTTVDSTGLLYSLCIYVEDRTTGLPIDGAPVEVRTTVGTVGTSGTSRYSGFLITAGGGVTLVSYRGDGKTFGTDTAVATYPYGTAVATVNIELPPPLGSTSARIAVTTPSVASIAPTTTASGSAYTSPVPGADLALQVQDADGRGVSGHVILVQSDEARLVANPGFALTPTAACAGATAQALALTTATDRALRGGLTLPGTIDLAVCAIPDRPPGQVVVTARSITTPLPDVAVPLRHVGRPWALDARFNGTTIEAVVTDADHQPVVDGTPVQVVLPTLAGTVAASCLLTRDGRVTTTAALALPTATALLVASYAEQGTAPTCASPGARLVVTALPLASVP
jgi:hypothetical protein